MKELVEILAKALVDHPEAVDVRLVEREKSVRIELRVAPEDVGKVIGKQGRVARAFRQVVKAAAARSGKKVVVEIL
ncbi:MULTISPECIES: KH domain-containing protein [Ammonifex]|uniref:RNA-binding protein KhpA n=2 Tax=Ammonifex TaxID=42837 RepID=C9R887_AMMDK|nr:MULTISPECIES: KH domain-containing protein [Ammonifex]ACX52516.1 conserved hypothetical protein [Ammonifex degensii KC4]RDV81153.1 KH domain-containing protein [Ammonifex thiophilus]